MALAQLGGILAKPYDTRVLATYRVAQADGGLGPLERQG